MQILEQCVAPFAFILRKGKADAISCINIFQTSIFSISSTLGLNEMMHQKLILPLAKLYQIVDKKKSEAIDWQLKTENVARPVFSFSIQFFLVITETNDMTASNQFNNVSF